MGRSSELYQEMVDQRDFVDEAELWEFTNLYISIINQLQKVRGELKGTPHEVLIDLLSIEMDERREEAWKK
tara:strand:- start:426 stop:638 length:213 start_codon:yes stop_codon:yes gene_type:complete